MHLRTVLPQYSMQFKSLATKTENRKTTQVHNSTNSTSKRLMLYDLHLPLSPTLTLRAVSWRYQTTRFSVTVALRQFLLQGLQLCGYLPPHGKFLQAPRRGASERSGEATLGACSGKFWQNLRNFGKKQQKIQQFLTKILRLESGAKECIVQISARAFQRVFTFKMRLRYSRERAYLILINFSSLQLFNFDRALASVLPHITSQVMQMGPFFNHMFRTFRTCP